MLLIRLVFIAFYLFASVSSAAEQSSSAPQNEAAGGVVQDMLKYALDYEGVNYRRGGTNPDQGFDCSGFVGYVFSRVEGLSLPHNANEISHIGMKVGMSELMPGDLVFFHFARRTIAHVGIYLGHNQFIHASSTHTGNVMISNMAEHYWSKHFVLARRIDAPAKPLQS